MSKIDMSSYILVRCRTGLCDCLRILCKIIKYAIKYDRKIILEFMLYKSSDLNTIFDFSNYPVEVITETAPILNELVNIDINTIPRNYKSQILKPVDYNQKINFNLKIDHPRNKLLVIDKGAGEYIKNNYINLFKYLKLKDTFYEYFKDNICINYNYNSIHIRDTDLSARLQNHNKIEDYIIKSELPVFIASDNNIIITELKNKYTDKILLSNTIHYNQNNKNLFIKKKENLHQFGTKYSNVLIEAIHDLLLLASAKKILIINNNSGYSRLARFLCNNKQILNKMIGLEPNSIN